MFKINTRPFAISPGDAELRAGSQQLGAFEPQPRPFAQPKPVARGNDEAIESGGRNFRSVRRKRRYNAANRMIPPCFGRDLQPRGCIGGRSGGTPNQLLMIGR